MPPVKKYTKEEIIDIASKIVREKGLEGLNARRLAKELGSSVNPIFNNFANMEEVTKAVYERIYTTYKEMMIGGTKNELPYKGMGLAYIEFARQYPEYFKIMFMQKSNANPIEILASDALGDRLIKEGMKMTGFTYEKQKKFQVKVWMLTHGIACFLATQSMKLSKSEIDELLGTSVREMAIGLKQEEEK